MHRLQGSGSRLRRCLAPHRCQPPLHTPLSQLPRVGPVQRTAQSSGGAIKGCSIPPSKNACKSDSHSGRAPAATPHS